MQATSSSAALFRSDCGSSFSPLSCFSPLRARGKPAADLEAGLRALGMLPEAGSFAEPRASRAVTKAPKVKPGQPPRTCPGTALAGAQGVQDSKVTPIMEQAMKLTLGYEFLGDSRCIGAQCVHVHGCLQTISIPLKSPILIIAKHRQ